MGSATKKPAFIPRRPPQAGQDEKPNPGVLGVAVAIVARGLQALAVYMVLASLYVCVNRTVDHEKYHSDGLQCLGLGFSAIIVPILLGVAWLLLNYRRSLRRREQ